MTGEMRAVERRALAEDAFRLLVPDFNAARRVRTYGRHNTHWRLNDVDSVERLASLPSATLKHIVAAVPLPNPGANTDLAEAAKAFVESFGSRDRHYRAVAAARLGNHLAFAEVLDALAHEWWDFPFYDMLLRGLCLHILGESDELTLSDFHEEHATKDFLAADAGERESAAAFLLAAGVTAQTRHGFVPEPYEWTYRLEEPAMAPAPELVDLARACLDAPRRLVDVARERSTADPAVLAPILTSEAPAVSDGWL